MRLGRWHLSWECLLCKHGNHVSSNPQCPLKKEGLAVHVCNPSPEGGQRQVDPSKSVRNPPSRQWMDRERAFPVLGHRWAQVCTLAFMSEYNTTPSLATERQRMGTQREWSERKVKETVQAQWHLPIILELMRLRQEDHELQAILSYIATHPQRNRALYIIYKGLDLMPSTAK